METLTRIICGVFLSLLGLVFTPGCYSSHSKPALNSVSLAAVEALHERLNWQRIDTGGVAIYQGALGYPPVVGMTPVFYPGRWDVYPVEKVFDDTFAPRLAKKSDAFLSLQVTQAPSSESVVMTVKGETLAVSIDGVAKSWCFPRSPHKTIQAWLEACSDSSWGEGGTK